MVLRSKENISGAWVFLVGVVLAVLVGVFTTLIQIPSLIKYSAQIYGLLVIIGIKRNIIVVGIIINSLDVGKAVLYNPTLEASLKYPIKILSVQAIIIPNK